MKQIFASAMGQYDNVGDTVLRRPFLRALRGLGPLNVFVGTRPDEYLSGLGLDGTERLYRNSASWRKAVRSSMVSGRAVYAFNAGEIEATRPYAAHYVRLAPLLAVNRVRGGNALHVGLGVRKPTRWIPGIRSTLRLCDAVSWRDNYSREIMAIGDYAPDWAFAEGSSNERLESRSGADAADSLVIAPRVTGERLSGSWGDQVGRIAGDLGLRVVVAAQIGRDNPAAEGLAKQLDAEAVLWDGSDHAAHEARLRETYGRARVVISERLHALVIGATEGAVPVSIGTGASDKAFRTIVGAGLPALGISSDASDAADFDVIKDAAGRRRDVVEAVAGARQMLLNVESRMREIYG